VLLTTKNSDDLEILVPDWSSYVCEFLTSFPISQSLIVPEAISCTVYEMQPSIGPPSLYFATPLAFPGGGVPLGRSP